MTLTTVIMAYKKYFPQFTVTKVVDIGDSCVVFVCCDDGFPPFQMPYRVSEEGFVSFYDMMGKNAREVVENGKVIYLDSTPLKVKIFDKSAEDEKVEYHDFDTTSNNDGGTGSGNFGHEGRPGKVGGSTPAGNMRTPKEGSNVAKSYDGDYNIRSVVKAQGYDGLPRILKKEDFDKAVAESHFVAQRTYCASSQKVLEEYRNHLYNGDWYIECTDGGAQYGQGMYCAADYEGKLSDGITSEMEHYKDLGSERFIKDASTQMLKSKTKSDYENNRYMNGVTLSDEEFEAYANLMHERGVHIWDLNEKDRGICQKLKDDGRFKSLKRATDDFVEKFEDSYEVPSYTETFTLAPDAKIIDHRDAIEAQKEEYRKAYEEAEKFSREEKMRRAEAVEGLSREELAYVKFRLSGGETNEYDFGYEWFDSLSDDAREQAIKKLSGIIFPIRKSVNAEYKRRAEIAEELKRCDIGVWASLHGYDAINAEGHGESCSYTVILNRTKTIILDDRDRNDSAEENEMTFTLNENGVWIAYENGEQVGYVIPMESGKDSNNDGGSGSGNH